MVTVDASIHHDQSEYQNGNIDKWKMNGNALENVNALQMPSNTSEEEMLLKVKLGVRIMELWN